MARQFFDTRAPEIQSMMQPNQVPMLELAHRMNTMNVSGHQTQTHMQPNMELQDLWMRGEMQKLSGTPQASNWTSEFGKVQSMYSSTEQANSPQSSLPQEGAPLPSLDISR